MVRLMSGCDVGQPDLRGLARPNPRGSWNPDESESRSPRPASSTRRSRRDYSRPDLTACNASAKRSRKRSQTACEWATDR